MPRPVQAYIDLNALKNNLAVVRKFAPDANVLAVVKADAYGHGLLRSARALTATDGFAVLRLGEGIALRRAGYRQLVLLLEGFFTADELSLLVQYDLTAMIHCTEQVEAILSTSLVGDFAVFLKINTGMNRLGFPMHKFTAALEKLQNSHCVRSITLATHFATADETTGIDAQFAHFKRLTQNNHLPKSLANSAAILRYPATHQDWVRPGIMLYGVSPFADQLACDFGLQPVMTLVSHVIAVQTLQPGKSVGYGRAFTADELCRVGVVACGYADGYPRHAATGTPVLVDGQRTRTLGRVSMDMLFVDLTPLPQTGVGSTVTLWGKGLPVEDVAAAAGTIGYELLCALSPRVPVIEQEIDEV